MEIHQFTAMVARAVDEALDPLRQQLTHARAARLVEFAEQVRTRAEKEAEEERARAMRRMRVNPGKLQVVGMELAAAAEEFSKKEQISYGEALKQLRRAAAR